MKQFQRNYHRRGWYSEDGEWYARSYGLGVEVSPAAPARTHRRTQRGATILVGIADDLIGRRDGRVAHEWNRLRRCFGLIRMDAAEEESRPGQKGEMKPTRMG